MSDVSRKQLLFLPLLDMQPVRARNAAYADGVKQKHDFLFPDTTRAHESKRPPGENCVRSEKPATLPLNWLAAAARDCLEKQSPRREWRSRLRTRPSTRATLASVSLSQTAVPAYITALKSSYK